MHTRISLIGYRGTGKTTVARILARELGWLAVDADEELERRAGRTIAEIFATDGEAAFRDLEEHVVAQLCERSGVVLSLGGGAVLRALSRKRMVDAGPVIWLTATPTTLAQRLAHDPTTGARRPNLTATGGLAEIEQLLAVRTPMYAECATFAVDTDSRSPEAVAQEILQRLRDS
jgi:shikimate kinase